MKTNTLVVSGNLTRDVEVRATGEYSLVRGTLAHNTREKQNGAWDDYANYFDFVYFTKSVKIVEHLRKGQAVILSGGIKQERWEQDGQARSKVVIKATNIELLFSKQQSGGREPQGGDMEIPPYTASAGNAGHDFEDDIPF